MTLNNQDPTRYQRRLNAIDISAQPQLPRYVKPRCYPLGTLILGILIGATTIALYEANRQAAVQEIYITPQESSIPSDRPPITDFNRGDK